MLFSLKEQFDKIYKQHERKLSFYGKDDFYDIVWICVLEGCSFYMATKKGGYNLKRIKSFKNEEFILSITKNEEVVNEEEKESILKNENKILQKGKELFTSKEKMKKSKKILENLALLQKHRRKI